MLAIVTVVSFGQKSNHTAERIDSICLSIDNNKNLVEGISEGTVTNKRGKTIGGYETRDLKDDAILYRLRYVMSTDRTYTTTYYYKGKRVIKAIAKIEIWDSDHLKLIHSAQYYFDNDVLVAATGETKEFSSNTRIFEEAQKFQTDFYADKR
jgi:hypothetical protein